MASIVVNQGLLRTGQQTFESTNYNAARNVQTMSIDGSATAFTATDTSLGSPANLFDKVFDATPTESGQTISCVTTYATGEGNFTIRRIALHDDTAANVTGASTTLYSGVDAQSITKTSDFSAAITLQTTFTSA